MNQSLAAEVDPNAPVGGRRAVPPSVAGFFGVMSAAVAVTVSWIVAAIIDVVSPTSALGAVVIDSSPTWLTEWAKSVFGTQNKQVLRGCIFGVIAVAAWWVGIAARRRRRVPPVAFAIGAALAAWAAITRAGSGWAAMIPPAIGAAVGVRVLLGAVPRAAEIPGPSQAPLGWDRRRAVLVGSVGAAAVMSGGALARWADRRRFSAADAQRPASLPRPQPAPDTAAADPTPPQLQNVTPWVTPTADFYRIDTALSFPRVDLDDWRLRVHGRVRQEVTLTYGDLLALPQVERTITLCCVSNEIGGPYIGNAVWQGVLLADVLDQAGVEPEAEQVFSTSLDGWTCGFPVGVATDGRDCMIAIGMNGEALPLVHGFPARLVVPGLYGYVSATKWLRDIELNRWRDREGYWIPRGWSRDAPIKTQSRIDVPRRGEVLRPGSTAIAGVAWAQHRGITAVEVRIDGGEWQQATLADEPTVDAWRQWWLVWEATPGRHTVQVRATDGDGVTQPGEVRPVAPDGATGWHTRQITISE